MAAIEINKKLIFKKVGIHKTLMNFEQTSYELRADFL
jgi:hypothetical protein